jgi:hypothetical protein
MSNRWRIRVAFVATVVAAAALSAAMVATAKKPRVTHEVLSARATLISAKNPLVVESTPTVRVVRAVVGDKLYVIVFEKRGDVWFYSSAKPASELSG